GSTASATACRCASVAAWFGRATGCSATWTAWWSCPSRLPTRPSPWPWPRRAARTASATSWPAAGACARSSRRTAFCEGTEGRAAGGPTARAVQGRGEVMFYRWLADVVVALHVGYVACVVVGLALILLGRALAWGWVRNRWFRLAHLLLIVTVVIRAML